MKFTVDCVVIGAGVVGLAVARQAQLAGMETILLERNPGCGQETSARNSEVIHAGIYYAPGSLKALLCVRGKHLLYEYCARKAVPHMRIGKLIVAVHESEHALLEAYHAAALANGVGDLQWLDASTIAELEPAVRATSGLLSPGTGIVDSHALMACLRQDFEQAGGTTVLRCPVRSGAASREGIELHLDDADRTLLCASRVVNSAGLSASVVARSIAGIRAVAVPETRFAVGHYFTLAGRSPFRRLVYPLPGSGGLGVHVTLDMAGTARFGPDVSWRSTADYAFDESRAPAFYEAIRRYFPSLRDGDLCPGYTGIRPKIRAPEDQQDADFVIQDHREHGIAGLVNLFGIESPGLTAALAIAEHVCARL